MIDPSNFKILEGDEWNKYPGRIFGSPQPGYKEDGEKSDEELIKDIENGRTPEAAGVDKKLLADLDFLNNQGIDVIYSLAFFGEERHPKLLKIIWESRYPGKKKEYITEIDGVDTGIKDFESPTLDQLIKTIKSALKNMKQGKNILVHCGAGIGRTGAVLAGISMLATNDFNANHAVDRIRQQYKSGSVEQEGQTNALKIFSEYLQKEQMNKVLAPGASYNEMRDALVIAFNLNLDNYVKEFLSKNVKLDNEAIQKLNYSGKTFALNYAVENVNLPQVRLLLEAGADVNFRSNDDRSLFSFALEHGDTSLIELICNDYRFELNPSDAKEKSPLAQAIENKNSEIIAMLITKGADLNKIDPKLIDRSKLSEYLLIAIEKGNFQAVKNLIDFEPSLYNQQIEGRSLITYALAKNKIIYTGLASLSLEKDFQMHTKLVRALISHHPERILELIKQGIDLDPFRIEESLPRPCEYFLSFRFEILKKAIDNNDINFLKNLVKFDKSFLLEKIDERTKALDYAISKNPDFAIKLAEIGFENYKRPSFTPIENALELAIKYNNNKAAVKYLGYFDKNTVIQPYFLRLAIASENLEILKLLFEKKIDINKSPNDGLTYPIIEVIRIKNAKILDLFLAQEKLDLSVAPYNYDTFCHETLIMHAIDAVSPEIIRKLVERGADVNQIINGDTAINFAVRNNKPAMLEILMRDYGANPNMGDNPLFAAKSEACVRLLIKYGADVNAIHKNKTILQHAYFTNNVEIFNSVITETCAKRDAKTIAKMIENNLVVFRSGNLKKVFEAILLRKDSEDILSQINDIYMHSNNRDFKQALAKFLDKDIKKEKERSDHKRYETLLPPDFQKQDFNKDSSFPNLNNRFKENINIPNKIVSSYLHPNSKGDRDNNKHDRNR